MWFPLRAIGQDDKELDELAREWLNHTQLPGSWPLVWNALWATYAGDSDLAKWAQKWLESAPNEAAEKLKMPEALRMTMP